MSADGTTIIAGTALNGIVAVDSTALQVKARYQQKGLSPILATVFDRPVEVLSLSTDKCFLRLRQASSHEALLALWDPASNMMSDLTTAASALFQNGLGAMGRSDDHSAVIVAANDSSGNVAVFAPNGVVSVGARSLGSGSITWVAANSDGSRFAAVLTSKGATQLMLLDGALNQLGIYASPEIEGIVFSRDDDSLYVAECVRVHRLSALWMATTFIHWAKYLAPRFKVLTHKLKIRTRFKCFSRFRIAA